jgi:hypothetical protein
MSEVVLNLFYGCVASPQSQVRSCATARASRRKRTFGRKLLRCGPTSMKGGLTLRTQITSKLGLFFSQLLGFKLVAVLPDFVERRFTRIATRRMSGFGRTTSSDGTPRWCHRRQRRSSTSNRNRNRNPVGTGTEVINRRKIEAANEPGARPSQARKRQTQVCPCRSTACARAVGVEGAWGGWGQRERLLRPPPSSPSPGAGSKSKSKRQKGKGKRKGPPVSAMGAAGVDLNFAI